MIYSRNLFFRLFLSTILLLFLFLSKSYALDVTLQWEANSESNLAGYYIYYDRDSGAPYEGLGAQEGNSPVDMPLVRDENPDPDVVEYTLHNLPESSEIYYFTVTAYNDDVPPLESGYSNEVVTNSTSTDTTPLQNINIIKNHQTVESDQVTSQEQYRPNQQPSGSSANQQSTISYQQLNQSPLPQESPKRQTFLW